MIINLIDGTYELFRHFYGLRRFTKGKDRPYGAVVGVLQTVLQMIENGDTYLGVATDHVIESFRNRLWADYKTGAGIEPALLAQFHPLEEALAAMGVVVWPMIELEADDALASAAHLASKDKKVEKVAIWTPDKDLAQCVRGTRVVQIDGRRKIIRDGAGIREKFGVDPPLIPDLLALVGDAADGYPGIPGICHRTAAQPFTRNLKPVALNVVLLNCRSSPLPSMGFVSSSRRCCRSARSCFNCRSARSRRSSDGPIRAKFHESSRPASTRLNSNARTDRVNSLRTERSCDKVVPALGAFDKSLSASRSSMRATSPATYASWTSGQREDPDAPPAAPSWDCTPRPRRR